MRGESASMPFEGREETGQSVLRLCGLRTPPLEKIGSSKRGSTNPDEEIQKIGGGQPRTLPNPDPFSSFRNLENAERQPRRGR